MTAEEQAELAVAIEQALRDVDGVVEVFRPGGVLVSAVDAGARALGLREGAFVRISGAGTDALRVEAEIGVAQDAAETLRRAHAAVAAVLAASPLHTESGPAVSIRLTVAHVVP